MASADRAAASPATEDTSPFPVPPVTSGYPLEKGEEAAIERVLRENGEERSKESKSE
jgi:hypothetical protein